MDREALEQAGIDYTAGLLHFAGKEELYRKYLLKFREDTHVRDAKQSLEKEDYKEVFEQIHALKGLCGTLGFSPLFAKTSSMVADLRSGNHRTLDSQLEEIEKEQEGLLRAIELSVS